VVVRLPTKAISSAYLDSGTSAQERICASIYFDVIKLQIIPMKPQHFLEQAMGRMTLQLMQFYHQALDDP
jgi:hypothetical protein